METEIQTETKVYDFKTRSIDSGEKNTIIAVLDESIRVGRNFEFYYAFNNDLNHLALIKTTYLDKTIKEKKDLFDKLDQRSYTYNRILDTAKLALIQLQTTSKYNYYSAELIVKFIQLEDVFGERKLKSIGVRFIEEQVRPKIYQQPDVFNKPDDFKDIDGVYIPSNLTGEKLEKYKQKIEAQKEIGEAIKNIDFND